MTQLALFAAPRCPKPTRSHRGNRRLCERCKLNLNAEAVREGVRVCGLCLEEMQRGLPVDGGAVSRPERVEALRGAV